MSFKFWKNEAELEAALLRYFKEPHFDLLDADEPFWIPRKDKPKLVTGIPDIVCDGDGQVLIVECKFKLLNTTQVLGALGQCAGYVSALKRSERVEVVRGCVVIDEVTAEKVAKSGRELREVSRALDVPIAVAIQFGKAIDYFDSMDFFIQWTDEEAEIEFPSDVVAA